jgi:hypothetical protein
MIMQIINNMKNILLGLCVFVILCPIGQLMANVDNPPMPGHEAKEQDLIKKKNEIVVAKFISLGSGGLDELGASSYEKAEIEITQTLRGNLSGHLKVSYVVKSLPTNEQEARPTIDILYIMFIHSLGANEYETEKLLPATDQNISRIKALIASQNAH